MSYHTPILTNEIVDNLIKNKDGIYLDCTMGFGGHSEKIIQNLNQDGILIGIDLDPYALKMAKKRLEGKHENIIYSNTSYLNFPDILKKNNINKIDGFLFDLGISSYQVDSGYKGLSYKSNSSLDMRMDENGQNLKDFLDNSGEKEIADVISTKYLFWSSNYYDLFLAVVFLAVVFLAVVF